MVGLRDMIADFQVTYLHCPKLVLGTNLMFDLQGQTMIKYDLAANVSPSDKSNVGFKHESTNKAAIELGKFWFYFFHAASASQTLGTEFSLNWAKKEETTVRLGYAHKFSDDTSGKVKVDDKGKVDGLLKMKLSNTATAAVVTSTSISDYTSGKTQGLPLGFFFDLKF